MSRADDQRRAGASFRGSPATALGRVWALPIVLGIAGLTLFLYYLRREPVPQAPKHPPAPPAAVQAPAPTVTPPSLPAEPSAVPLPPLDASDADIAGALTESLGAGPVERFLRRENIVRNWVATIDNLPRSKLAVKQRPVTPAPGDFATAGGEDALVLSETNYARYAPFIAAIDAADARTVVALYRRYQPLFQEAYEDLGYPQGVFEGRLLEVIDHLLATPEVEQPVRLVHPSVYYQFADKELESRSAGQKLLIRMGPQNTAIIKRKLREIRAALLASPPP